METYNEDIANKLADKYLYLNDININNVKFKQFTNIESKQFCKNETLKVLNTSCGLLLAPSIKNFLEYIDVEDAKNIVNYKHNKTKYVILEIMNNIIFEKRIKRISLGGSIENLQKQIKEKDDKIKELINNGQETEGLKNEKDILERRLKYSEETLKDKEKTLESRKDKIKAQNESIENLKMLLSEKKNIQDQHELIAKIIIENEQLRQRNEELENLTEELNQ